MWALHTCKLSSHLNQDFTFCTYTKGSSLSPIYSLFFKYLRQCIINTNIDKLPSDCIPKSLINIICSSSFNNLLKIWSYWIIFPVTHELLSRVVCWREMLIADFRSGKYSRPCLVWSFLNGIDIVSFKNLHHTLLSLPWLFKQSCQIENSLTCWSCLTWI